MNQSFNKFKNKIILEAFLKSFIIGLSLGLITFAIPFTYYKVTGVEYNLLYLLLISVFVWLIIFLVLFLILKPSMRKIAIRIDKELGLNEKVQTLVEYKDQEGLIINLQREDTLNILSGFSIKNLTMKFGVFFFTVLTIALIAGVTAIAAPKYEEPIICVDHIDDNIDGICDICGSEVEIDPDYDLDDWTIRAIKDLIEYVESSNANLELKSTYVSLLTQLINDLENVEKDSEMKEIVSQVIGEVNLELDKLNTNNEVYTVLKSSDSAAVTTLALQINKLDLDSTKNALDGLIYLISGSKDAIVELDSGFGELLRKSNLNKDDELYKALIKLTEEINSCSSSADVNSAVIEVVNKNSDTILDIIGKQKVNKDLEEYVENTLREVFGIEEVDDSLGDDDVSGDSGTGGGGNNNIVDGSGGGLGTGEVNFGSVEEFFDPDEGNVVYGDVITKYYGNINGKLQEGLIPEELREIFDRYYKILFGDEEE